MPSKTDFQPVIPSLPNIPWEERLAGNRDVIWRFSQNPIINHDHVPSSNSIFNSAIAPFGDGYAGVFRCDSKTRQMQLHSGRSRDGINWDIKNERIQFIPEDKRVGEIMAFEHAYDPRVCWLEDRYYVTWCNGYHGPTVGVGYTTDFETYYQMENAYLPFNRNGVLFPRRINGKYVMLNRPSDNGHTPFGDIYLSESPDMVHWGRHRFVMGASQGWQSTKIGAGPIPIETDEGWLLVYHGVLTSCNGFVYSFGAALLDLDEPWKALYRSEPYLLAPQAPYERTGDVPNVAFPCAALVDGETGRMTIYYGGADTVVCLAFAYLQEVVDFVKSNSKL
ncbi:MAG: glycoside hydrolase family 130 protein [Caldilineales bacterium]|nr:glycoside hydrolase family 130 protein [Caldilineales bacterium]